ncbi:CU044_2847 family protein [Roseofilum sp. SID3]|uniref:CU044_2847 family protein n=1 Tax=unclassified Roseofilum TaxID=2620099 RepID=UPI000E8E0460|nr:hypothetical protein [Roseofilum sp. Belize Diploria]MBP0014520.1 hypothetical protein [Roseofilum sp. SID3]MBP0024385.1 hypothetical protein [Roseofilum sp. SID2]MBP0031955.1 hypothetical protein [Roseofilum sp. Belize BBD 4]MBP0037757.1 hypothetical protein [Roseofilum sp. SID1]HBR00224.1 hypothetical protein [Cyanobacteria bacterium UBA11691]
MMKLAPLRLDDNTVIYIEATEDVETSEVVASFSTSDVAEEEEAPATTRGFKEDFEQHITDLQSTIVTYTNYSLAAFKKVRESAIANVDKVTLEFGVEIGGEMGIPYVTKGTAKSNLKIQVECSFKKDETS